MQSTQTALADIVLKRLLRHLKHESQLVTEVQLVQSTQTALDGACYKVYSDI